MKLLKHLTMLLLLIAAPVLADIEPELRWYVDVERPAKYDINLRRGETAILEPTFRNYSLPINLTAAHLVLLRYAPSNATNWYYVATGTVHSATGGVVQIRWTSAMEATNSSYSYEIAVQSTESMLLRSWGTINLTPGVAVDGSTSSTPTAVTAIDWATVDHSNIGAAPFLSGFDTADLEAFDDTLLDGTADLDIDTLNVRGAMTGSASGLTNFPTAIVTNVVNAGTAGLTGSVSRVDGTVSITFPVGGGGGGSSTLDGLTDVTITAPAQGQALTYDEVLGGWTNAAASGESQSTNRLLWVVNGVTMGYVDTNGITMVKGSLQLYEEDLNCNVRAYDGSVTVPAVSFYASPTIGWYRKSFAGSYVWAYAHSSNDVLYLARDGLYTASTNSLNGFTVSASSGFKAAGSTGLTTNFTVITSVLTNESGSVTGTVSRTLNFKGGILVP